MANSKPLVSILVLNYNHLDFLKPMFDSTRKLNKSCRYETFLVDNSSSDGSVDYIKKYYPEVKIVQTGANLGTPGFNIAIPRVKGDYIAWLGVDSKLHTDSLANMIRTFNNDKKIGAIYPLEADFSGKVGDAGMVFSRILYFFLTTRFKRKRDMIGVGPGMIRKALLNKIGYIYDPLYFYGYEDIDLAFQLRLMGYDVVQDNSAIFYHRGSISMKRYFPNSFRVYLGERNALVTFFKVFQLRTIFLFLPYYLVFRLLLITADLFRFRFATALARIKGILWVPLHFLTVIRKRRVTQRLRVRSDKQMLAPIADEKEFLIALLHNLIRRQSLNIYQFNKSKKN